MFAFEMLLCYGKEKKNKTVTPGIFIREKKI